MRGHFPLETQVIKEELEECLNSPIDGEIIIPFFYEGGRITIDDIHYIRENNRLIPVGETEFAKDTTFGYRNSNLKHWIEEKTLGKVKAEDVISISLDDIRNGGPLKVSDRLIEAAQFQKIIVNAEDYSDLEVFKEGLLIAMSRGKSFVFRTAASFVKVFGEISSIDILRKDQIRQIGENNGGLVIVGSHVKKSTEQLEQLLSMNDTVGIELEVNSVAANGREEIIKEIIKKVEENLTTGRTVVFYTSRKVVKVTEEATEQNLKLSTQISEALVEIVRGLKVKPGFLIAKGGITSSDIGIKGLRVKKAHVLGQVLPGIPVWKTGEESKFPGMAYIIFPGNVGGRESLKEIVELLNN